jgi:peroxin-12
MSDLQYASLISNSQQSYTVKPTIFDIMAQENMNSLFQQSFKHILKWLINNTNSSSRVFKLSKLKQYTNEIYLLIHSAIEYGYLKRYDSLFTEYFYGMKRAGLDNCNKKRILSILFSLCLPYLKSKLDDYYEEIEKFDLNVENSCKIKKIIKKFYPHFHLFYSMTFLFYKFKFIINKSDFNSPLLHILNLKLVYNMSNDQNNLQNSTRSFFSKIFKYLNYAFTSFIFLLQFLKWHEQYVDNESYDLNNNGSLSFVNLYELIVNKRKRGEEYDDQSAILIEPPRLPLKLMDSNYYKLLLKDKQLCPLCMSKRKNECALSVSGFVFCYTCIFKFIKQHNRCPITGYQCTTKNIIRIYSNSKVE